MTESSSRVAASYVERYIFRNQSQDPRLELFLMSVPRPPDMRDKPEPVDLLEVLSCSIS